MNATEAKAARRELLEMILDVSFERRKVVLSSGKESDFYLDLRQTLLRPRGMLLAGRLALARLSEGPPVDSVGGMAVGAVPFVSAVLAAAAERDAASDLLGFFVRKQGKQHGLGRRIEGGFARGQTVALLEDTVTTGGSALDALDAVVDGIEDYARRLPHVEVRAHEGENSNTTRVGNGSTHRRATRTTSGPTSSKNRFSRRSRRSSKTRSFSPTSGNLRNRNWLPTPRRSMRN